MDNAKTDLLMQFLVTPGAPVPGGSQAAIRPLDRLSQGFKPGGYFDLEKFSFDMELKDDEGDQTGGAQTGGAQTGGAKAAVPKVGGGKSFIAWRSVKPGADEPDLPYRCKPAAFSFSRNIDDASPVLFKHCASKLKFTGAVLIKRGHMDDQKGVLTFLRMEFVDVMLTSIDWSDGDAVKENCRFTFKDVLIKYVRRKQDGTVASTWPCEWHQDPRKPNTLSIV